MALLWIIRARYADSCIYTTIYLCMYDFVYVCMCEQIHLCTLISNLLNIYNYYYDDYYSAPFTAFHPSWLGVFAGLEYGMEQNTKWNGTVNVHSYS